MRIHQGRLRLDHERLARFLTAEHLVLSATHGIALAQLPNPPAHRDLRDYALLLARVFQGASLDTGNKRRSDRGAGGTSDFARVA